MIVVVGSRHDAAATALVAAWSGDDAALLSADDHIAAGWVIDPAAPARGVAVVAGQTVDIAEIRGVLTRRPSVLAEELVAIDAEDRAYVAAEVNAMLVAWLGALPCPVVNRPTPTSLCGAGWGTVEWRRAAARCGFHLARRPAGRLQRVVVCGDRVFGARSIATKQRACALARAADVTLLEVQLAAGRFVAASSCPDLSSADVRGAVLDELLGSCGRSR
jgi:hypothetical protein